MANPEIRVEATSVAVTPGQPETIRTRVWNYAAARRTLRLRVVGLDEAWINGGTRLLDLDPGASADVELQVTLPRGFPASEYVAGLLVEPLDASGHAAGASTVAHLTLLVRDAAKVLATLEPADTRGGRTGRLRVVMRNRTDSPLALDLHASSPDTDLRFYAKSSIVLPPQGESSVAVSVRGNRPFIGERRRRPFLIRVQGHTTPVILDGSFTQRPVFGSSLVRFGLIAGILGVWVILGLILLGRYTAHTNDAALIAGAAKTTTTTTTTVPAATRDGSGSTEATGPGQTTAPGQTTTTMSAADAAAANAKKAQPTFVSGEITAADGGSAAGFIVKIEPTNLVDENALGATPANSAVPSSTPIGKIDGQLLDSVRSQHAAATHQTVTTDDGTFGWPEPGPGYYLVTLSKAHYTTRKFIANVTGDGKPITFAAPMQAGDGTLSGRVVDSAGRGVGGADVSITNGTVTLTTRTPTTGDVGSWSVGGISTPSDYVVSAGAAGFGLESRLVDLGAGGTNNAVDFVLHAGVGTITGKVTESGANGAGIGGLAVNVTDGTQTRSSTTLTEGLPGYYSVPGLPLLPTGSAYTVTVSGPGWTTGTRNVPLTSSAANGDIELSHDSATITGLVERAAAPNAASGGTTPIAGAGIVLASDTVTRKTTTVADGSYVLEDVPPGRYVVTIEKFGFISESVLIEAVAGVNANAPVAVLQVDTGAGSLRANAQITGIVQDAGTSARLDGASVVLKIPQLSGSTPPCPGGKDCTPPCPGGQWKVVGQFCELTDDTGNSGSYSLPTGTVGPTNPGVPPGRYDIVVSHLPKYETTTVSVQVPSSATVESVTAPPALLPEAAVITGQLVSNAPDSSFAGQSIKLDLDQNGAPCNSSSCESATATSDDNGAFSFGHVQSGTYTVVAHDGPDYIARAPVNITVDIGADQTVPVPMDRKPHLVLTLETFASGSPSVIDDPANADITLDGTCNIAGNSLHKGTCPGVTPPPPPGTAPPGSNPPGQWLVTELSPGDHTVVFNYVPAGKFKQETRQYTLGKNTTTTQIVVLANTPKLTTIVVQYSIDGTSMSLPDAQVAVNGVIGFNPTSGTAIRHSYTLTTGHTTTGTHPDNGQVFFIPGTTTNCSVPAASSCTVNFVSDAATLQVTDTRTPSRFVSLGPIPVHIFTDIVQDVTPTPASLKDTSSVTLHTGSAPFLSDPAPTVTVTAAPQGVSARDITVTASATGTLCPPPLGTLTCQYRLGDWRDPGATLNGQIRVGTYSLTLHKNGFTDTVASFQATAGEVVDLQVVLPEKAYVILHAVTPAPPLETPTAIPGATYTLTPHGTDKPTVIVADGTETVAFSPAPSCIADKTCAVFALDAASTDQVFDGIATEDGYGAHNKDAHGKQSPISITVSASPAGDGTIVPVDPDGNVQLDQLATVTGVVRLIRSEDATGTPTSVTNAGGVTVKVTQVGTTNAYTGVTSSDPASLGRFTITGTAAQEGLALAPATFSIEVVSGVPDGYDAPAAKTIGPLPAGDTDLGNLDVIAKKQTVNGTVVDAVTGTPLGGVVVTISGSTLAPGGTDTTNADPDVGPVDGKFSISGLWPVHFSISFTKAGYRLDGTSIDLDPSVDPPFPPSNPFIEKLPPNQTEITGTTRGQYGSQPDFELDGVTVQLQQAVAPNLPVGDPQTPTGDTYDIPNVRDGNYQLMFTKPLSGFAMTIKVGINVGGGAPALLVDPVILPALKHPVKVTVTSKVGSAPIIGADVTLTPDASLAGNTAEGPLTQRTTATDGSTTFPQVLPGKYKITAQGNGGHLDDNSGNVTVTVPTDDSTTNVPTNPVGGIVIQEGQISGTAFVTDTGGTHGSSTVIVDIFNGPDDTGTPIDPQPSVAGNGNYSSIFLAPGQYTVKFSANPASCPPTCFTTTEVHLTGGPPPAVAQLAAGARDIDGAIKKFGTISGTVLENPGGGAATAALVKVYIGTDTTVDAFAQTGVDAGGGFSILVPPGNYTVVISETGFVSVTIPDPPPPPPTITVNPGATKALGTISLDPVPPPPPPPP